MCLIIRENYPLRRRWKPIWASVLLITQLMGFLLVLFTQHSLSGAALFREVDCCPVLLCCSVKFNQGIHSAWWTWWTLERMFYLCAVCGLWMMCHTNMYMDPTIVNLYMCIQIRCCLKTWNSIVSHWCHNSISITVDYCTFQIYFRTKVKI